MPFPKDAEVEVEEEFDFLFTSREEEEEEEEEEDAAATLAELSPPSMTGSKTTASTSRPSPTKPSSLAFDRAVVLSTPNCLFPINDDENDDEAK
jgi:hypothetical protein